MGQGNRYEALDGMRGIAALAVVIGHTPALWGYQPKMPGYPGFMPESHLAVNFFFVLSGFVLAHGFGEKLVSHELTPWRFTKIRLIRLYPLYFVGMILGALSTHWTPGHPNGAVIAIYTILGLLFIPQPGATMFHFNFPAWSLHFELVANIHYGLMARVKRAHIIAGALVATSLVGLLAIWLDLFGFGAAAVGGMADGVTVPRYLLGTALVTFCFFSGILIYRLHRTLPADIRVPTLVPVGALGAILFAVPPEPFKPLFEGLATVIGFPAIVIMGAFCRPQGLIQHVAVALGGASYAIYVLHIPVYRTIFETGGEMAHPWPVGAAFLGLVLTLGWAIDRYFDRPIRSRMQPNKIIAPAMAK